MFIQPRGNALVGFLITAGLIWGVSSFFSNNEQEDGYMPASVYSGYSSYDETEEDSFSGGGYGEVYYSNGGNQDLYIYSDCEEGSYCYAEDEDGDEVEIYVYDLDDGYGYGEDEYGNEVEFTY